MIVPVHRLGIEIPANTDPLYQRRMKVLPVLTGLFISIYPSIHFTYKYFIKAGRQSSQEGGGLYICVEITDFRFVLIPNCLNLLFAEVDYNQLDDVSPVSLSGNTQCQLCCLRMSIIMH